MPVKVRCSGCQKVLNAPERARGKAIKCPDCSTVIKVPAEKQVAKQASAPPPSSSSIIANLDLNRLEDAENRICPNCGADVAPEDIECPKCEVLLETGQLSEKKKFQRARKGPPPSLYYKQLPSDAWSFIKENKTLVLRTVIICFFYSLTFAFEVFGVLYVSKMPLKVFCGSFALVTLMVPPGWAWFLHITIITPSVENKRKLPKRILFDLYQCVAYGINFFVWTLAMGAPFHAVALVCWLLDWPVVAASFAGVGLLFALLAFPVAMVHMAMPVTRPAWEFWTMEAIVFRNLAPVLYWLLFLFLTMLPAIGVFATGAVLRGNDMIELAAARSRNIEREVAVEIDAENSAKKNAEKLPDNISKLAKEAMEPINWEVMTVPIICWVSAATLFGMTCIFNMRSNGLFGFVFRDRLNLISQAAEIKYVAKPKLDEEELELIARQVNGKKVAFGMVFLLIGGFAFGVAFNSLSDTKFLPALSMGLFGAGGIGLLTGVGMLIYFAMKRPAGLKWGAVVTGVSLLYAGLATMLFLSA